ncbi:hypothetical protein SORBI_3002G099401 [Sorghum bicolor]|uniref:Uncharacterized protein n=1 Tax=Sorghum bicolor TaxID=4558 RepID=A0A1W0W344_SORBI|nr:hypothetical protein SORBI_3002G099401 [Sorghum bicolor]
MPLALSADFGFSDLLARNVGDCRNSLVFFESLISSFSDDLHATLLPADQDPTDYCARRQQGFLGDPSRVNPRIGRHHGMDSLMGLRLTCVV